MDGQTHGNQPLPTREWLTGRVMVLLSHFYQAETDPAVVRAQAADWFDTLWDVPQADIEAACRSYLRSGPRRRPSPGDIRNLAVVPKAAGPRRTADDLALMAPEVERVSPDAANAILAAAGFTPRRMEAVRQSPMALSLETAHQRAEVASRHWSDDAPPDDPMWRELLKARERAGGRGCDDA